MEPNNQGGRWDSGEIDGRDDPEGGGAGEGGGACGCIATILLVILAGAVVAAIWLLTGP